MDAQNEVSAYEAAQSPVLSQGASEGYPEEYEVYGDALSPSGATTRMEDVQGSELEPQYPADPRFQTDSYVPRPEISNILDLVRSSRKPSYAKRYKLALAAHAPVPRRRVATQYPQQSRSQPPHAPASGPVYTASRGHGYGYETRPFGGGAPAIDHGPGSAASASVYPPPLSVASHDAPPPNTLGLDISHSAPATAATAQPSPSPTKKLPRLILHGPRRPPDYVSPTESQKRRRWEAMDHSLSSDEGQSASGSGDDEEDDSGEENGGDDSTDYGRGARKHGPQPHVSATGEFKCELDGCGNVYVQLGELLRHQRTSIFHTERQYVCECGNSYARPDGLKRHRTATGHTTPSKAIRGAGRGRGGRRRTHRLNSSQPTPTQRPQEATTKTGSPVSPFGPLPLNIGGSGELHCENCVSRFPDPLSLEAHQSVCYFTTELEPLVRAQGEDEAMHDADSDEARVPPVSPTTKKISLSRGPLVQPSELPQPIQLPMLPSGILTTA